MRIAIITFHRAYNCGAMLQAWALKTVLERMGHDVKFLASNDLGRIPPRSPWSCRAKEGSLFRRVRSACYRGLQTVFLKRIGVQTGVLYDRFREQYLPEFECPDLNVGNFFDVVISGSDQVLCSNISGWNQHFICNEIPDDVAKIMYAGSRGDYNQCKKTKKMIDEALSRFIAVSVREPYNGYEEVLDPTLLLDASDYSSISSQDCIIKEPYLYVYSCTCTDFEISVSRQIAAALDLKLVFSNPWGRFFRNDIQEMVKWMSPELMIQYIRDAEYVIAGSFHATVLSVLHNKSFVTLRNQVDKTESRAGVFLRKHKIIDRLVNPESQIDDVLYLLKSRIPEIVYSTLNNERKKSLSWLTDSLRKCKVDG